MCSIIIICLSVTVPCVLTILCVCYRLLVIIVLLFACALSFARAYRPLEWSEMFFAMRVVSYVGPDGRVQEPAHGATTSAGGRGTFYRHQSFSFFVDPPLIHRVHTGHSP